MSVVQRVDHGLKEPLRDHLQTDLEGKSLSNRERHELVERRQDHAPKEVRLMLHGDDVHRPYIHGHLIM